MTATNYTVNGDAPTKLIEQPLPQDKFVVNLDANNTVYLDTTPGINASSAMPLPPGASKVWIAGQPCFAIAASGQSAQVNVSDNVGALFNPAGIASQIISQGLTPAAIAAAGNAMTLLASGSSAVGALLNVPGTGLPKLNLGSYNTLILFVGTSGPNTIGVRESWLTWYPTSDPAGNPSLFPRYFRLSTYNGSFMSLVLPVKAGFVGLTIPGVTGVTFNYWLYGSSRNLPGSYEAWNAAPNDAGVTNPEIGFSGFFNASVILGNGAIAAMRPQYSQAGPFSLSADRSVTTGESLIILRDDGGNWFGEATMTAGINRLAGLQFRAPNTPIVVSVNNLTAGATVTHDVYLSWNPQANS